MTSLVPLGSQLPAVLPSYRTVSKSLARLDRQTQFQVARVQAGAEVCAAQMDALTTLASIAMQNTAQLSMMEAQIVSAVPHAAGRVRHLADTATLQMACVLASSARSFR